MLEGRNFTTAMMGEPNTEYDIHAQSPEQGVLSAATAGSGGGEQVIGHPAAQFGEYSYAAQAGGGTGGAGYNTATPYGNHPTHVGGGEGGEVDDAHNAEGGGAQQQHLQVNTGAHHGAEEEAGLYAESSRLAQPLKLFIGQVPKTMIEEDLAYIFEPYGRILDLTVIRDRRSGNHRGCAFVTYEDGANAMKVAEDMHGKLKFDGAQWPAQVRPAAGEVDTSPLVNNRGGGNGGGNEFDDGKMKVSHLICIYSF
jgi:hypothetical protein